MEINKSPSFVGGAEEVVVLVYFRGSSIVPPLLFYPSFLGK